MSQCVRRISRPTRPIKSLDRNLSSSFQAHESVNTQPEDRQLIVSKCSDEVYSSWDEAVITSDDDT